LPCKCLLPEHHAVINFDIDFGNSMILGTPSVSDTAASHPHMCCCFTYLVEFREEHPVVISAKKSAVDKVIRIPYVNASRFVF
jgi:hypothetical protein